MTIYLQIKYKTLKTIKKWFLIKIKDKHFIVIILSTTTKFLVNSKIIYMYSTVRGYFKNIEVKLCKFLCQLQQK